METNYQLTDDDDDNLCATPGQSFYFTEIQMSPSWLWNVTCCLKLGGKACSPNVIIIN